MIVLLQQELCLWGSLTLIWQGLIDLGAKIRFRIVAKRPRHPVLFAVARPNQSEAKNRVTSG